MRCALLSIARGVVWWWSSVSVWPPPHPPLHPLTHKTHTHNSNKQVEVNSYEDEDGAVCSRDSPTCNLRAALTFVGNRQGTIRLPTVEVRVFLVFVVGGMWVYVCMCSIYIYKTKGRGACFGLWGYVCIYV